MTWTDCIVIFFAGYGATSLLFSLFDIACNLIRR